MSKKLDEMVANANIKNASPGEWYLVWDKDREGQPTIFDENGRCVCVLSTGTLGGGPYSDDVVLSNAKLILQSRASLDPHDLLF